MKTKKLTLPALILLVATAAMIAFVVFSGATGEPKIKEHAFPYSITYELYGKSETVEDVFACTYLGINDYGSYPERSYSGTIIDCEDERYVLVQDEGGELVIYPRLHAAYLMGDGNDYYNEEYPYAPALVYFDNMGFEHTDEATFAKYGAKLVSWDYPEPLENSFDSTGIAAMSSESVKTLALIGVLALLACLLFVKKEKELVYGKADKVCALLNVLLAVTVLPFSTILAGYIDILGANNAFFRQMLYCSPAVTALGIAASLSLRRKGFSGAAFAVQFAGPVALILGMLFG